MVAVVGVNRKSCVHFGEFWHGEGNERKAFQNIF